VNDSAEVSFMLPCNWSCNEVERENEKLFHEKDGEKGEKSGENQYGNQFSSVITVVGWENLFNL
jgi:hypothetical protein